MTIIEIVAKYLIENGYDGLCIPGECGCGLDEDFCPCTEMKPNECVAAYHVPSDDAFKNEFGEDAEMMYSTEKLKVGG